MFTKLKERAAQAVTGVTTAIADLDMDNLTGRAKDAADAAREIATKQASRARARTKDPEDAYQIAIDSMLAMAATLPSIDDEDMVALTAGAKTLSNESPYRF